VRLTLEKYSYSTIIPCSAATLSAIIQSKKKYLSVKHASLLCPSVNYTNTSFIRLVPGSDEKKTEHGQRKLHGGRAENKSFYSSLFKPVITIDI
jgi:hypothetical protein